MGQRQRVFVTITVHHIVVSLAAINLVRDERFELPASVESGLRSTTELITHGVSEED